MNKSNAILPACMHLLETFGLECRAFACKKYTIYKKVGEGGGALPLHFLKWGDKRPPCPSPSAAYEEKQLTQPTRIRLNSISRARTYLITGEPVNLRVTVRPAENYPVDLYYLMDMSLSMEDDLASLKALGGKIGRYFLLLSSQNIILQSGGKYEKYCSFLFRYKIESLNHLAASINLFRPEHDKCCC